MAAIPGSVVTRLLDDEFARALTGYSGSGGATVISFFGVIAAAFQLAIWGASRQPGKKGLAIAVSVGFFTGPVTLTMPYLALLK